MNAPSTGEQAAGTALFDLSGDRVELLVLEDDHPDMGERRNRSLGR